MDVEGEMKTVYLVRQLEVIGLNAKVVEEACTVADRVRRTRTIQLFEPGVDYDIELIRDDFNIFAPYRRYTTRSPVPPPRYDEPDPIVLVETQRTEQPLLRIERSSNSGGDYVMKEKNKEVETDARRLTSDVGEGGSSMIRKRRLDADVDSIQPKSRRSVESRRYRIGSRILCDAIIDFEEDGSLLMKKILKNLRI
ncbi:hypothetical protein H4Q26_002059 [Puccinia striiformis f. sp. tritici PST-130]|nr:hypothetical protein H4Q26_002059 [Puccinia striiformis f. sp. tritici PST-130]